MALKLHLSGAAIALLVLAGAAQAQWVWTDANGTRQYSDQPPPSSVPRDKIIRTPQGPVRTGASPSYSDGVIPPPPEPGASAPAAGASAARNPASAASKPLTPDEAFRKRQKDAADAQAKADKAAQASAKKADDCARAKRFVDTIDSGRVVASTDKDGNRKLLDEADRAKERARAQAVADKTCQ